MNKLLRKQSTALQRKRLVNLEGGSFSAFNLKKGPQFFRMCDILFTFLARVGPQLTTRPDPAPTPSPRPAIELFQFEH